MIRKIDTLRRAVRSVLAILALASPATALAAPGDSHTFQGRANISIVEPVDIQRVADLRFGRIIQPTTAGTLTLDPDGTESSTGGVTANMTTPQVVNGRGPAAFAVFGDANRRFHVFVSNNIDISNGSATMRVDRFEANAGPPGFSLLDATGYYALFVGARLNVGANQQAGSYTGTFDVTVRYN